MNSNSNPISISQPDPTDEGLDYDILEDDDGEPIPAKWVLITVREVRHRDITDEFAVPADWTDDMIRDGIDDIWAEIAPVACAQRPTTSTSGWDGPDFVSVTPVAG